MKETFGIGAAVLVIILLIVFGPFILIAGFNFLLDAAGYKEIPYTLGTWFGSLLIGATLRGGK